MQTMIRVEKLNKTFNQHQVLHAIDLNVHAGEMVALLGPSGSGSRRAVWRATSVKAAPTPAISSSSSTSLTA